MFMSERGFHNRFNFAGAVRAGLALIIINAISPAAATAGEQGANAVATDELQEIVVTSTKATEDLQHAPAAITVATGVELTSMGIADLGGLSDLIPSARLEPFESSIHLYIRGIGSEQDRNFVDQLVATVIDGVYMPRNTSNIPAYDVSQIEVLPGPQGTLYGAGASGGVVQVSYNRPTQSFESSFKQEIGNFGTVHSTLVSNIPLNDEVAVRAAFDYDKHNEYETQGADSENYASGRIGILAKPNDNFTAYVWGTYNRNTGQPTSLVVTTGPGPTFHDPSNPWDTTFCSSSPCSFVPRQDVGPSHGDDTVTVVGGQFDYKIGNGLLTFIPTYVNGSTTETDYVGPLSDIISTGTNQYTTELRFTQDLGSSFKLLTGFYWLKLNNFLNYAVGAPSNPVVFNYENDYAGFAQLTYSMTDAFRLIGGIRFSSQNKQDDFIVPALEPVQHTWHPFDWKAGFEYDLNKNSMFYGAAQTGFTNGTFDYRLPTADNKPTLITNTNLLSFTLGMKNRLLNGRLEVNDELFYYDYKDYLIQTVIIQPDGENVNAFFTAPKAVSYGNQLDIRALITDNFQLRASYAYDRAYTKTFTTAAGETYVDQKLFEAPESTVDLGAIYRFDLPNGGNVTGEVDSYLSGGYLADDFPAQYGAQQNGYTRTNASLTYNAPSGRWSLGAYCKNLENGAQMMPGATIEQGQTIGVFALSPPRTFGVRFTASLSGTKLE
ncbi:MAG TPA: TonB-dependent receptor [Steroidobacteraceae bacterium]|jgi:iron complex outermembrane receptor protein